MPFPAQAVGRELEPAEKTLAVRDILAYAAGLGASEPEFLDDTGAGGLRALPFLCVSLEWPVLVSLRGALDGGLAPDEARRGVHSIQDSIFHRPMVPGDRVVTEGRLVSARRVRSGVLTVCKLTTREAASGAPVTTSWSSSIYRDVALGGEDATLETAPDPPPGAFEPLSGDVESLTAPVPREMPHVYSECARIWNPIHTERRVALAAGLPDIILQGTATWALAGLAVLRRQAGGDLGRLRRISGRFTGMVIPGEHIVIRQAPEAGGVVRFDVLTASGRPAVSQGVAVLAPRSA